MRFLVRNSKAIHDELRRIAAGLIAHAERVLTESRAGPDQAVHEVRKSMKKLRAMLRLTRSALGKAEYRAYDRAIHDFSDTLSATRDSAISVSSLEHLVDYFQPYVNASSVEPALQRLRDNRNAAARAYLTKLESGHYTDALQTLRETIADWRFTDVAGHTIGDGLERVYRQGRQTWKTTRVNPTTKHIHDLRKQVKYLWYLLRLLRACKVAPTAEYIAQLEMLGESLGQEHDLAVLAQTMSRQHELCADTRQVELITGLAAARQRILLEGTLPTADLIYRKKWKQSPPGKLGCTFG